MQTAAEIVALSPLPLTEEQRLSAILHVALSLQEYKYGKA
jgi:hypothetical protein